MVNIEINPIKLYSDLATNPLVLADGCRIAGIYRGFGNRGILVERGPKAHEKGFKNLGPIDSDIRGIILVRD